MEAVFEIPLEKKEELIKILEANPYGEGEKKLSFSKVGYKIKEGAQLDEGKEKLYLSIKGADEYLPFAKEKLGEMAERCDEEKTKRILQKIEDEENAAQQGMGSIFG